MPTRLKRPSITKKLAITGVLIAAQIYLAYNALGGNYGITSQLAMQDKQVELHATIAEIDADIESYRNRIALFDPNRLDPDILTQRARELVGMTHKDDLLIPLTGQ
ncbi:FtsB family cell division protein [Cucumibacter marinus]|uniref:FtsB family cell division protein n=1 Tax=Cucumibacter marinus TaxID=1121252 RepID=UPI0003F57BA4|nr:septum formation initiator family protein [Cucumibacter marinus]